MLRLWCIITIESKILLYYVMLYYTMLYYTVLCHTILCHTILCYAEYLNNFDFYYLQYYVILYYVTLYYVILYYNILCYTVLVKYTFGSGSWSTSAIVWQHLMCRKLKGLFLLSSKDRIILSLIHSICRELDTWCRLTELL